MLARVALAACQHHEHDATTTKKPAGGGESAHERGNSLSVDSMTPPQRFVFEFLNASCDGAMLDAFLRDGSQHKVTLALAYAKNGRGWAETSAEHAYDADAH